ncbi:MAG: peptidoglycan editing factor PgeF [Paludibacteraceae bacterium]
MIELVTYPMLFRFNEIKHFTSTRNFGISAGSFSTLNLGLYSEDKPECVRENFNRLFDFTGIKPYQLFIPHQTHGDEVLVIDRKFLKQSKQHQQTLLYGKDAVICNLPAIYIGVTTADCVPVLLYDPIQKAVGAIHAGWRGTCAKIVAKTVERMKIEFDSNPSNMLAVIGPSISANAYSVGEELMGEFEKVGFNSEDIFHKKGEMLYLDLWKANESVALETGIKKENIEISGRCTFSECKTFFSARKLGIKSGRMISVIGKIS